MPLDATALPSSLPEGYTNPLVAQSHLPGGRLEKPHRTVLRANCRPRIEGSERRPTKPTQNTVGFSRTFPSIQVFIGKGLKKMSNEFKRKSRYLSPVVRQKISGALKGRSKTEAEKQAISHGMRRYWADDRNFPADADRKDGR